jgi:hypothetical protein
MENETEKLSANLQEEHRIFSLHLLETFCSAINLNTKVGRRRRSEEKLFGPENDDQIYVQL